MRVKICGITSVEDALHAEACGADALGMVFYPQSPRAVSLEIAARIAEAVGPFVTLVGLFVNPTEDQVRKTLSQVNLHLLQFHGDESPEFCASFSRPFMKALRMKPQDIKPELDIAQAIEDYKAASGILFDAYKPGVPGGTGETFDWRRVPKAASRPLILAGGLTPTNVAEAIKATQVYAVDVSGGVESAPGKKDPQKVADFIQAAKQAIR